MKKPYIFQRFKPGYDPSDFYRLGAASWDHPQVIRGSPGEHQYRHNHVYYLVPSEAENCEWWRPASENDLKKRRVHGAP